MRWPGVASSPAWLCMIQKGSVSSCLVAWGSGAGSADAELGNGNLKSAVADAVLLTQDLFYVALAVPRTKSAVLSLTVLFANIKLENTVIDFIYHIIVL